MEVLKLFQLISDVIVKYDVFEFYRFVVTSQCVDVVPNRGTFGNDILHDLVAIEAYKFISTNEDGLFMRLSPIE